MNACLSVFLVVQIVLGNPLPPQYIPQSQSPSLVAQYPAQQQEVIQPQPQQQQPQQPLSAHHGFMYSPQTLPNSVQPHQFSSHPTQPATQGAPVLPESLNSVSIDDPDFQLLARSLKTGIASVGYNQPVGPQELPPCSSDGRSVTIDSLRISPDSLIQIARLAQAFGSNPDWKKLRINDMKTSLDSPMNPTHEFAARSIGL